MQCTMPNSGMVNGRMTMEATSPSLVMPRCGYNNFSHTWSRLVTVVKATTFDSSFYWK